MRKTIKSVAVVLLSATLFAGCTMAISPIHGIYTDFKGPFAVSDGTGSSKVGMATGSAVLGFGSGDVSITAAMENGKITKIHHVDFQSTNVLGLYSKFTVIVYGE